MNPSIDGLMYAASQLFLIPVLAAIGLLFVYAFYALGAFLWQMAQRRAGVAAGFDELQPEDDGEAGFVEEKPLPPEEERVDEDHDEDLPLRENEELERLARAGAARATTSTRARQTEKTRQGPRCMTGPPS